MLSELAERFGDRFKESMKEISEKALSGADREFFVSSNEEYISEQELNDLAEKISDDLNRIPKDKITDQTVRKKVTASLKARFQKIPELKNEIENIAAHFTVESLNNIKDDLMHYVSGALQEKMAGSVSAKKIESMRNKYFQEIQQELEKYEEVLEIDQQKKELGEQKKSNKKRELKGYFSKNRENAYACMVADICIASDPNMLENKNYFEFVLFDEERRKNVGTDMLLSMQEPDGKKQSYN